MTSDDAQAWTEVPLFDGRELAELRRIARAEQAREQERERIRRAGEKMARETRRAQGLSEHVEVQLWSD